MSYKLKTLIVFDTNSLRSMEAGEVAYSFFAFGRPFQVIEEFIQEKNLEDDIHIAIPAWALEELKDQKQRQYKTDIIEFQKLAKRLSGLPHIPEFNLPDAEFDCATYVGEKAREYLKTKSIKLLEIKEEVANSVLRSMMSRVMRDEGKKAPFANLGKSYKDAGFKDNIVWESLMNFNEVANYDKIIFLTKDSDFNKHCEAEFLEKWKRYISILKDENNLIADITKDYGNYIENRKVYDYAQTEYFDDYLKDLLNPLSHVQHKAEDLKVENYRITDHCEKVVMEQDEDGDFTSPVIYSRILLFSTFQGEKVEIVVRAKTKLSDLEYMDIQETAFEPEILS